MEGQNILYGNIDDLRQICAALETQASLRNQISSEMAKKQNLDKDIAAEEKLLRDTIDSTVKKRREHVVANFDKEISKVQDRIKNLRSDRNKAKTKGIEARIKDETADLVQENKNLRDEIRTVFRQKGVSKIFDTKPVYVLYYPKSGSEKILFLVAAAMALFVIPTLAVWLTNAFWLLRVIEYMLVVAVFVGLYILGYRYARMKNKDAFMEVKVQRATILKNENKIRRIKKSIRKDKDEEIYNLGEYDDDIKEQEDHINDIIKRKNEAIADFERTTKADIEEEIINRDIEKINKLKARQSETNTRLKELETQQKNITIEISTNYTAYIGEENMTTDRIEKMIILLGDGRAKTIGDAVNILKNSPQ